MSTKNILGRITSELTGQLKADPTTYNFPSHSALSDNHALFVTLKQLGLAQNLHFQVGTLENL